MKLIGIIILAAVIIFFSGVASASPARVSIKDFQFSPAEITIQKGEMVIWTNSGQTSHTVKFADSESPILKSGGTYSKTFNEAGTFNYECGIHPSMKGTVTVNYAY
jgi:plastocyanin